MLQTEPRLCYSAALGAEEGRTYRETAKKDKGLSNHTQPPQGPNRSCERRRQTSPFHLSLGCWAHCMDKGHNYTRKWVRVPDRS